MSNYPPDNFIEHDGLTGVPPATPVWGVDVDIDNTVFMSGDASLKFVAGVTGKLATDWFPMAEDKAYLAAAMCKGTIGDKAEMHFEIADKDLATPYQIVIASQVSDTADGTWRQFPTYMSVTGGGFARVVFTSTSSNTNPMWFDAVSVKEVRFNASLTLGPTGAIAALTWTSAGTAFSEYDPFEIAANDFTIKRAGNYEMYVGGYLPALANGKYFRYRALINAGSAKYPANDRKYSSGHAETYHGGLIHLNSLSRGDVITVEIYHNDTVSRNFAVTQAIINEM